MLKASVEQVESLAMELRDRRVPIESDEQILRARRTAATTRIAMGAAGAALTLADPALLPSPLLGTVGFVLIALTSLVQLAAPRLSWLGVEESLSGAAGVLIVGFAGQRVTILSMLWLVAVASGVLARGGRVHWIGRTIVLCSLALPIVRYGSISAEYGLLLVAALGLLLTTGRLTRELNLLLRQARLQVENAETLLLAGDIAARMSGRSERAGAGTGTGEDASHAAGATDGGPARVAERAALQRLISGHGLSMAVQPIVDVRRGAIHAYEALARFDCDLLDGSPLRWFELADELGERAALERACLRLALDVFAERPSGTSVSVNLSAPVLLEAETMAILHGAACARDELGGLIVEITEETLVRGEMNLADAIEPLRARGVQLAVDDMGAGYSGLRQITSVLPGYLKLDRSLVAGIDSDGERAALVGALAGYSSQVGSLLIAEGVETEAELRTVRRLGVPLVQGFYLSRPGEPWPEIDAAAHPSVSVSPVREALAAEVGTMELLQPA